MITNVVTAWEYKDDYFTPFLESLLETNKSNSWMPKDPEVVIDVNVFSEDSFEFIIKVGGHYTKPVHAKKNEFLENGPAVCIELSRNELQQFIIDLKSDFLCFNKS